MELVLFNYLKVFIILIIKFIYYTSNNNNDFLIFLYEL